MRPHRLLGEPRDGPPSRLDRQPAGGEPLATGDNNGPREPGRAGDPRRNAALAARHGPRRPSGTGHRPRPPAARHALRSRHLRQPAAARAGIRGTASPRRRLAGEHQREGRPPDGMAHLGGRPRLYRGIGCGEDSLLKSDMNLPHADILIRVILGKK